MKTFLFIAVILLASFNEMTAQTATAATGTQAKQVTNPNGPKAKWDKIINDYGAIEQGIPKETSFKLTNEGKEPLLIQTAKAGCGCTNLKYTPEPVLPGESTIISVTFNAAAMGAFTKSITVTTNADPNPIMLLIKGTVVEKK